MSKTSLAGQMHTSRAAFDRLLDLANTSVSLATLTRAARALGRKMKIESLSVWSPRGRGLPAGWGFAYLCASSPNHTTRPMFSHVVIFWTDPSKPEAAEALLAGAEKYLQPIPGVRSFHVGRMVKSERDVVDQSYQVALNLIFDTKQQQDDYQVHPLHLDFVEKAFKPNCVRVLVYDFA